MTVSGEVLIGNKQQRRSGKGPKGERSPEKEKIWQAVVEGRKRLNALRDAMREEQKTAVQNLTPDKIIKGQRQRGKGGVLGRGTAGGRGKNQGCAKTVSRKNVREAKRGCSKVGCTLPLPVE